MREQAHSIDIMTWLKYIRRLTIFFHKLPMEKTYLKTERIKCLPSPLQMCVETIIYYSFVTSQYLKGYELSPPSSIIVRHPKSCSLNFVYRLNFVKVSLQKSRFQGSDL